MAKEKFHTSHHHERRYHKHGIKKVAYQKYRALKGMEPRSLRNLRRAKKNDIKQNKHAKPKVAKVEKKDIKKKDAKPKDVKKEAKSKAAPKVASK